ncbi:Down syndrome cell adhesion molecule-like protein Dscam2 [Dinothrombium tinctorium]|uniref:Down syndrome cell adhesion molecule-like protein Dscam2 n=1 Tax=Dinothrombium tinctorium TaxID=1965070 RepID=A0A3S3PID7_9ACAR|nr:Down syndrome cell adhesion molecule-like protein Dscam2 [Dinothrombium tinctorium]
MLICEKRILTFASNENDRVINFLVELQTNVMNEMVKIMNKIENLERKLETFECKKELEDISPSFVDNENKTIDAFIGDTIVLNCTVRGYPRPVIKWKTQFGKLNFSDDKQILIIENFTLIYDGEYKCEASSKIGGTIAKTFRVNAKMLPNSKIDMDRYQSISDGLMAIACTYSGLPKPNVMLLKDEEIISFNNQTKFTQITGIKSKVSISVAKKAGLYTCYASSEVGNHTSYLEEIENYQSAMIAENIECKLLVQKIEISEDKNVKNVSDLSEFNFDIKSRNIFLENFKNLTIFADKFNFDLNSIYNVKAALVTDKGLGEYSEWYTYVAPHICGNNVPMIVDHVILISHQDESVLLKRNFTCSTLLSNFLNESICINKYNAEKLTLYDGIDQTYPKIDTESSKSFWICSSSDNLFITYVSEYESDGFSIRFSLESKIEN